MPTLAQHQPLRAGNRNAEGVRSPEITAWSNSQALGWIRGVDEPVEHKTPSRMGRDPEAGPARRAGSVHTL